MCVINLNYIYSTFVDLSAYIETNKIKRILNMHCVKLKNIVKQT